MIVNVYYKYHCMKNKLNKFQFHDSTLNRLDLDFVNNEVLLEIEFEIDSPIIVFNFKNIENLNIGHMNNLKNFDSIEIFSAGFKQIDNHIEAKFNLLLGFGLPSWEFSFKFDSVLFNEKTS